MNSVFAASPQKHAALRSKSKNWLDWNQNSMPEWSDISTADCCPTTCTYNRIGLVQSGHHHNLIQYSSFSPSFTSFGISMDLFSFITTIICLDNFQWFNFYMGHSYWYVKFCKDDIRCWCTERQWFLKSTRNSFIKMQNWTSPNKPCAQYFDISITG